MAEKFVIIGSGPTAISAARPLIEAGHRVLMLEAGAVAETQAPKAPPSLADLRTKFSVDHTAFLLKPLLAALRDVGYASPKLRTAAEPGFGEDYAGSIPLAADHFRVIGALGTGGLSRIWGAAVASFDTTEFNSDLDAREMVASYNRVAQRIGISGDPSSMSGIADLPLQPPLPLSPLASDLLNAYQRKGSAQDFTLNRCAVAVTSEPSHAKACVACRGCLWGCTNGSIYSAVDEIPELLATGQLEFCASSQVISLQREGNLWLIYLAQGKVVSAHNVIIAAGVPATTKLVLQAQNRVNEKIPFLSNPAFSFAAFMPRRLGQPLPQTGFGLAQLSFDLKSPDTKTSDIYGLMYDADTMSAVDLMSHMPLSRPGAMTLVRALLPGLTLGLGYYPGRYSQNEIWLDGSDVLHISGGVRAELPTVRQKTCSSLRKNLRSLGAYILPGSMKDYQQGAEVHYAGTLPTGKETLPDGQVKNMPGLYVADASTFQMLPAKSHTFTAMANADRIGRALARTMA